MLKTKLLVIGYGKVSGHIFDKQTGVHIATMEGMHEDGPGPFRNPKLIEHWTEIIITAVNEHAKLAEYKTALEGLTPGGSEYINSPEACTEYIRKAMDHRERFKKLKADVNALVKILKDYRAASYLDMREVDEQARQAIAEAERI